MNEPAEVEGGGEGRFPATNWTTLLKSGITEKERVAEVYRAYRNPVVCYVQRLGYKSEDAEDLAQGFFTELLCRGGLEGVHPLKGRFRTFMIAALKHYVADQWDRSQAQKRGGGQSIVSWDAFWKEPPLEAAANPRSRPDRAFDRAWAESVMASALAQLSRECSRAGKQALFTALEPVMHHDQTSESYRQIASSFGISEGAVRVAAKRLRDRLSCLVQGEVKRTVFPESTWRDELRYLIELMGDRSQ